MGSLPRSILLVILCLVVVGRCAAQSPAWTQQAATPVPARIVAAVDEKQLVTLPGNIHPLARVEFDRGAVQDGQALHRMLLLLQRGADQEAALQVLLGDQQSKSSPNYRAWLTPQQFGQQFGPADADIQTVTAWLGSHGFTDIKLGSGRTVIEFSGNVGQVRGAFHTEIHQYAVRGGTHFANASDPQIPAALRPVIAGVVTLNNFPVPSHAHRLGAFQKSRTTGETKPLFTFACGSASGVCFGVGPADFATIYNTAPLLSGSPKIDGTGQGIAIVGSSNINVQDVIDFRTMFGLPQNFSASNVILNGPDPGLQGDAETEADLDVEWSGAVAPGARIDFVTSQGTESTSGVHLSALYVVDQNVDAVMSESFGSCEQNLGTSLNQFYSALWEQAAAQGITVILSAGDGGSAGCDDFNTAMTATHGLAVSGYASTPYNVAVGGTDFDQIGKFAQYWNTTVTPTSPTPIPPSVKSYIPEITWNDSCAAAGLSGCPSSSELLNIVAGSGGVSTIYPKPSWQVGKGVPNDNHRDVPDVSLFASDGFNGSFYIICQSDATPNGSCNLSDFGYTFEGVGGTSASAPAFAGIMALVNQKQATGQIAAPRQGNANYFLYPLAQQQNNANLACNSSSAPVTGCTFNDVTKGNDSVPCTGTSPNCSSKVANVNGVLVTAAAPTVPAYTTTAGYDLATGLGSVNAQNLVNKWASVNTTATTTTLTLNGGAAVNVTHGQAVSFSVAVAPGSASGDVSLIATPSTGLQTGVGPFTLASGAVSGSTTALPGGAAYNVHAHYEGNGTDAPSDSAPVSVTVGREASKVLVSVPTFDPSTGQETGNTAVSVVYGSPYLLRADVTNASGTLSNLCAAQNCPTGTVTFTDTVGSTAQGAPNSGTFALNSVGYTEDQAVFFPGGNNVITAAYSGDPSFAPPAQPTTYNLTVTPAPLHSFTLSGPLTAVVGQPIQINAMLDTGVLYGAAPSGTFTYFDNNTQFSPNYSVSAVPGTATYTANIIAYSGVQVSTLGTHSYTARYQGDPDYASGTTAPLTVNAIYPTSIAATSASSTVVFGASVMVTATVTSTFKTPAMSGSFSFYGGLEGVIGTPGTDGSGNQTLTASAMVTPPNFGDAQPLQVTYSGDSNYEQATASYQLNVLAPDFSLAVNPTSLALTAGQQVTTTVSITPTTSASSLVALNCAGPFLGVTCVMTPSSQNLANSVAASATLTLTALSGTSAPQRAVATATKKRRGALPPMSADWGTPWGIFECLAACAFLALGLISRRGVRFIAGLSAASIVVVALGCGGGSSSTGGGGDGGIVAGITSVTLTLSSGKVSGGGTVTATAAVGAAKSISGLTGTVQFYDLATGKQAISGALPVTNGTAQVQYSSSQLGIHEITAEYSGDQVNKPAQSLVTPLVITGTDNVMVSGFTDSSLFHTVILPVTIQ
jgi:hypothetical protein